MAERQTIQTALARPSFRGAALAIQSTREPEWVIHGPSETGKTLACLHLADRLCREYAGVQGAFVRKVRADIEGSILEMYRRLFMKGGVAIYGGENAGFIQYPNGSRIWIGGMDRPGKSLSTARDFIYINQAEELKTKDWETLTTRATGRAGNMPWGMVFGDANPGPPFHWIVTRPTVKLYKSIHRDNPSLYTEAGGLTEQGRRTMEVLDRLTGLTRRRLRDGDWAQAEGAVYSEFDVENITTDEPDLERPIELAADEGYIDPRAILFIQRTPGRILIFDEMYHSKHLAETCVREVVEKCGRLYGWKKLELEPALAGGNGHRPIRDGANGKEHSGIPARLPDLCAGSPEAKELQARFRKANIPYRYLPHKVLEGIEIVRGLIKTADDVRIIQVHKRCVNFLKEIQEGYKYPEEGTRTKDEVPLDEDNHAMDALRYWCYLRARK